MKAFKITYERKDGVLVESNPKSCIHCTHLSPCHCKAIIGDQDCMKCRYNSGTELEWDERGYTTLPTVVNCSYDRH